MRRLYLRLTGDYPCQQFVEAVTDYLEGAMPAAAQKRFEHHLSMCAGCEEYLAQIRRTVVLTGRVTIADVDALGPQARESLLGAFRQFQAER